jgi:hypothetical protein
LELYLGDFKLLVRDGKISEALHLIRRVWVGLALEKQPHHRLVAPLGGSDESCGPVLPDADPVHLTGLGITVDYRAIAKK